MVKTIEKLEDGTLIRTKQQGDFSVAPMLTKEMANINWEEKDAKDIKNLVRGLNPIMGAVSSYKGKKIKFWNVDVLKEEDLIKIDNLFDKYKEDFTRVAPGTIVISDEKIGLFIKANNGIIKVNELQGENAKKMDIFSFLRGNKLEIGEILV